MVTFAGVPFVFPPKDDDQLNNLNCRGQTIDLPDQPTAALWFLGASDGRLAPVQHHSTTITLRYVDGVTEAHQLWLTSWSAAEAQYGNRLAVRTQGFHVQNRVAAGGGRSLFVAGVYPEREVAVERLRTGHDEPVHIFALTLARDLSAAAALNVDALDWGGQRAGRVVATARLRALAAVGDLDIRWTMDDGAESHQERISLAAGQSRTVSFPYELQAGTAARISLTLSSGGRELYTASRTVSAPPLLTVATDRRLYLRQPAQQLAHWQFELPDMFADESGRYPLSSQGAWDVTSSWSGLNPVPGSGGANVSALNTKVPDSGTWYVCAGGSPLDAIDSEAFVVEGFGHGGAFGGHNRTALDCRSPSGVGLLINTTDKGTRYAAMAQLTDGSTLSAASDRTGRGDQWNYFAVVREKDTLKFYVRGVEAGQPLTLVKTVAGVADDASIDTNGADWRFGGGPWYPSFDQYRVTKIPSDRTFTLLTGDRITIRGIGETTGRIDAYVNVDVAEVDSLRLVYELTDADGNNPRPVAETAIGGGRELPDLGGQIPYSLATQGYPDRARNWPEGMYVPATFRPNELEAGEHRIRVRLLRDDEELAREQTKLFAKVDADPSPTQVAFDGDGTLRIKGRRTFPVGIISGNLDPDVIDELHDVGFNFVLPANPLSEAYPISRARALLDQCHARGLGVVLELKSIGNPLDLRRTVLTFRDHPAIIGWHLFEEPVYPQFTLEEIDTTWRTLRQLDPYHFFDVIDWSYSTLERYAPWSGVLIVDRYVIGPEPVVPLVRLIREQVEAAQAAARLRPIAPRGVKPVWTCLQTMTLFMGIDRAPTEAEIRAETYASIVAGAQGIIFFEYYWAKRSETFDFVADHVRQVRQITPVLIDPNPVRRADTDASVDTWLKRHDGSDYLIAINETELTVEAKLDLPGATELGRIDVLFEDRQVQAAGPGFTDTFEPLAVHVYRIAADTARDVATMYPVYAYGEMNRHESGHAWAGDGPDVVLATAELEDVCLAIDNRHGEADTFDLRVELAGSFPLEKVRVGRLAYLPVRAQNKPPVAGSPGSHVSYGEVADAIIPASSLDPITVPAGEVRHIWLTIDGHGMAPGDYSVDVHALPITARRDRRQRQVLRQRLEVRVLPLTLPAETPLAVSSWDQSVPLSSDECMRNFVEHRMNVFQVRMDQFSKKSQVKLNPDGSLETPPDFSDLTEMLRRGKPHGKFYIETYRFRNADWPCTDGSKIKHLSEPWRIGYRHWVTAFKQYMESIGIGTDQWWWCPFDEAFFNKGEETTFVQAQICYEIDPTIQFFQDTWPTRGPDQLARWRGVTNVTWCPDSGVFNQGPWHWLRAEDRPLWEYFCYHQQRGFEPHCLYRGAGPRAWHRQLEGTAFFAPFAHTGSDFNDLDGPWGDTCLVIQGPGREPINTRRWEAWREGIEDYMYLYLLDQALKADSVSDGDVEQGRQLIAEFCNLYETQTDHRYLGERRKGWTVSAGDARRTEECRRQIGRLIVRLTSD